MQWQAKGECIEDAGATLVGDPGSVTIAANVLVKKPGTTIADSCTVTVTVQRTRAGSLDAHFGKGGNIVGIQYRTATFTSTP